MSTNVVTSITIVGYAQTHYVKSFAKTYKSQRDQTWSSIEDMIYRLDNFMLTTKVEMIHQNDSGQILKCEFKIAGSNESAKSSGNRMIVYHEYQTQTCHVLLIYSKSHIKGDNETARWRKEIMENCEIVENIFEW